MWFKSKGGDTEPVPYTSEQPNPAPNSLPTTLDDRDLEIPDGGYGWVQVFGIFLVNGFTWGQTASYGVYLAYYLSNNVFPEATSIDYAFIGGFQFALAFAVAPIATVTARQLGMRATMLFGISLQTLGFICASFVRRIWQLYITQGILAGIGSGFIFVPATPILSQWFSKKRSLATGIGSAGSGIGGLIFSFGITSIVHNVSLAWAFRITAFICGAMNLLAVALLRNRNDKIKPPQLGFDTKLLVRYDVWLFLAWGFVTMFGYMTLLYSLSDFASSINLTKTQAGDISAFLNLGTAIGRPAVGLISDKFGRIEVAGSLTLLGGLASFAIWIPTKTYAVTIFFSILVGTIFGVFWMTVAPIAVNVVGVPEVPSMLSIYWIIITAPTLFTEVIALKLRRPLMSNEYLYPQIFTGISYTLASVFLLELRRVIRKRDSQRALVSSDNMTEEAQESVNVTITTQPAGQVITTDIEKKIS
ncbi:major facilitator superfamily protein [Xylogone sp. PMI_703]|nr:major facilitator superfamily protein [Xylogone sp. PMI_703]